MAGGALHWGPGALWESPGYEWEEGAEGRLGQPVQEAGLAEDGRGGQGRKREWGGELTAPRKAQEDETGALPFGRLASWVLDMSKDTGRKLDDARAYSSLQGRQRRLEAPTGRSGDAKRRTPGQGCAESAGGVRGPQASPAEAPAPGGPGAAGATRVGGRKGGGGRRAEEASWATGSGRRLGGEEGRRGAGRRGGAGAGRWGMRPRSWVSPFLLPHSPGFRFPPGRGVKERGAPRSLPPSPPPPCGHQTRSPTRTRTRPRPRRAPAALRPVRRCPGSAPSCRRAPSSARSKAASCWPSR